MIPFWTNSRSIRTFTFDACLKDTPCSLEEKNKDKPGNHNPKPHLEDNENRPLDGSQSPTKRQSQGSTLIAISFIL